MPELSPFLQMETMRRTMLRKQRLRDVAERSAFKKRHKESRREEFAQKRDIGGTITYLQAKMLNLKRAPTGIRATGPTRGLGAGRSPMRAGQAGTASIRPPGEKAHAGFRISKQPPRRYIPPGGLKSGSIERSGKMWTTSGYTTKEGERDSYKAPTRIIKTRGPSEIGASFGLGGRGRGRPSRAKYSRFRKLAEKGRNSFGGF